MFRRSILAVMVVLLAAPALSLAQFKQADWDLTLVGSGANDQDFDSFNAAVASGVGYFLTDQFEIGLRPSIIIADGGSQSSYLIPAFADFHFDLGKVVPFVGGNIGYGFGSDNEEDSWTAGVEGGVKWFLNSTTYVFWIMQYQFSLENGFDEGGFVYGLGLGVRL